MSKGKTLVIVESPSKAHTISSYLGDDYIVLASKGHITELASGGKYGMGIDIDNNFKLKYKIIDEKINVIDELINNAMACGSIVLSSDEDREGESIAWHISERLKSTKKPMKRMVFNEITKKAITKALDNTRGIDMNLVHSQEARRALDRIIGFSVSPFLIKFFGSNLSAGRVQSVATRFITEREKEILSFEPEEYWNIFAKFNNVKNEFFSSKYEIKIKNKQEAENIKNEILKSNDFIVSLVVSKSKKEKPFPPLITSKLQQVMAKKYSFDAERTMRAAQTLYESGYCTYIRTDSSRISEDSLSELRKWMKDKNFNLSKSPNIFSGKASSQDAHECIRPTNINNLPDKITVGPDEKQVYNMIWTYFVASQMDDAIWDTLEVHISDNSKKHLFKASGKCLKNKGFLEIFGVESKEINIPILSKGDILKLQDEKSIILEQKFTQPPPRYNDATLIEKLESKEIGRPATYADTLKKICLRNYVEKKGNTYYATDLGIKITDILIKNFPFMSYEYTSLIEKKLDEIADGKLEYTKMMNEFYNDFKKSLAAAYVANGGEMCHLCKNPMITKLNKQDGSKFMACSTFPSCRNTRRID